MADMMLPKKKKQKTVGLIEGTNDYIDACQVLQMYRKQATRLDDQERAELANIIRQVCLRGRALTVTVGSTNPVAFSVHEHLICHTSDYFKAAVKAHWETSTSGSIALDEEDAEIFEIYLQWLFSERLPVRNDSPGPEGNAEYVQLSKAYALGEFLQDINFKDAVSDAILSKFSTEASGGQFWFPSEPVIRRIYDGTPEPSAARRLLVDMYLYAYRGRGHWWTQPWVTRKDLPKPFRADLAIAFYTKRPRQSMPLSQVEERCAYHEHQPGPNSCYLDCSALQRGKTPPSASGGAQKIE
ncbi:uncharacterized protein Triagg1_6656 [Trichoderma aggressivum f. europaeum]|uniref:BTB domain-containing protein n=1 Tax=Trichoderma aggressivum f. europaeum TaxID=173218 RepID=A0AAE1IAW9_9HYPO|nr:hypothetical protein Triagg1_6656 [Trichoderma aggressivum f. europaeum]